MDGSADSARLLQIVFARRADAEARNADSRGCALKGHDGLSDVEAEFRVER